MGSATRVASSASQIELSSNFPILYFFSFLNSSIILNVTILNRSVDIQHPCLMPPVTSTFSFILPSFITVLSSWYICTIRSIICGFILYSTSTSINFFLSMCVCMCVCLRVYLHMCVCVCVCVTVCDCM